MWMAPGSEPMTTGGDASIEQVLGGRFMQFKASGESPWGKTESISMMGFDRRHKKYTTVGFDTMGTYFVTAEGEYDAESKTISMYGEDEDPIMNITQKFYFNMIIESEDRFVYEVIFVQPNYGNDGPFKMVEVTYTRQ